MSINSLSRRVFVGLIVQCSWRENDREWIEWYFRSTSNGDVVFSKSIFVLLDYVKQFNALSCYIEINVRILIWKSRPARGREKRQPCSVLCSRLYLCVHVYTHEREYGIYQIISANVIKLYKIEHKQWTMKTMMTVAIYSDACALLPFVRLIAHFTLW